VSDTQGSGRGRKVLGWILVVLGALSVVDFFSPVPIPSVGAAALISGGVVLVAGLGVLRLGGLNWKALLSRGSRSRTKIAIDPLLPVSILKLARERGGELTVSAVAIALSVSLDQAEVGLEECVRRGAATADYDEAHAVVLYRFPEFLPPSNTGASEPPVPPAPMDSPG
jgi:hypothetical protein